MGIKEIMDSCTEREEPDERLSVTGGPGIPDEQLPDTSNTDWEYYIKIAAGMGFTAGFLYSGYKIGLNSGKLSLDAFFDSLEPSVEEVFERAAESGSKAMIYEQEVLEYFIDVSQSLV